MDSKEYGVIKQATAKILKEYNIISSEDFYSMDEDIGCELYENLKAGVLEEFGIDEDEIEEILEEILESTSEV